LKVREKKAASKNYQGFFAYSSQDKVQAAIIERAVELHNTTDSKLRIYTWREMKRNSSRIILNILKQIEESDYLLADLSGLNPNVLFETGYAFGKRKRLILLIKVNSESDRNRDLDMIEMLTGLQINSVQNTDELVEVIRMYGPDYCLGDPEIEMYEDRNLGITPDALFLKGITNHEIALATLKVFRGLFPNTLVDDWNEDRCQLLPWYLNAINHAKMIAALFVSPTWDNAQEVNARYSFICGLAIALGKKVQMIGLPGYQTVFDYKDMLKSAESVLMGVRIINQAFLPENRKLV
jgi:nucleoside 2-deoxyribosyltransferase